MVTMPTLCKKQAYRLSNRVIMMTFRDLKWTVA